MGPQHGPLRIAWQRVAWVFMSQRWCKYIVLLRKQRLRSSARLLHVCVCVSQRTYALAPTMRSAACLVVLALLHVALAEQFAAFDSASASSVYLGSGDFGPAAAISGGSSYWSSSGSHADGKPVSWTGALSVRRKAIGIKVDW